MKKLVAVCMALVMALGLAACGGSGSSSSAPAASSGAVMATQKAALQETLMAEQFPDAEPLLLPDFPQCIANLKNGECAAVMIDEISAEQYMQTVEGLAIGKVPVEIDPEEGGNAVAVMKGNTDLLDWVNERIAAYEAEGLLEQWFQEAQEKAASMGIE